MFGYYNSVQNYLDLAYHPVETAMTNRDDLVHLLVRLGAAVNTIPKNIAKNPSTNRISLKDWIDNQIDVLETQMKCNDSLLKAPAAPVPAPLECSRWQKFYREYQESLKIPLEERKQALQKKNETEERERLERLEKLEDAKAYFVEVKQLIEDHGAKTLKEKISTNETPKAAVLATSSPPKVESHSYTFLSTGYNSCGNVPQHLLNSYDELYEACYVGDHEKIQSLCLPAEGAKPGLILLNISVKMMDSSTVHNFHGKFPEVQIS